MPSMANLSKWNMKFAIKMGESFDRAVCLYNDQGLKIRVVGCTVDVTDRKLAEQATIYARKQFEQIADTAPGIVYVYDLTLHRNVYVSRGIQQVLGYSPSQIESLGSNFMSKLVHPDEMPFVRSGTRYKHFLNEGEI